jgi:diphosphomevalonate decarboxylase
MQGINTEIIKVSWRCPSNIAIVKYWGKKEHQVPCNASVSMTLTNAFTEIEMQLSEKKSKEEIALNYFFEGEKNEQFEQRLLKYLITVKAGFPFLRNWKLTINSKNSFPHSAGIASSASAFGALALCLSDLSYNYFKDKKEGDFLQNASRLARLGSGSACRSVYPGFVLWGDNKNLPGSSDEFAVPITGIHKSFKDLQDAILIIEKEPKKVSSSAGHALMKDHPFANNRFDQANQRTSAMLRVLSTGNWEEFIHIAESEALTLHAMMLTSKDYYLLMKPGTLAAIEKLINFRKDTKIPVCFTLDAGPNLHVLYPASDKHIVNDFLKNDLRDCVKEIIFDKLGKGPEKIKS